MIWFAVDELRLELLRHYLAGPWGEPLRDRLRQVSYAELFRTRTLERGAWIFTALDALSAAELKMVHHLQAAARNAGMPVLNGAGALHRFDLLELLHERGWNEFRAHRADGPLDRVRFPMFLRMADEHDGSLTPLLRDRGQLGRAMAYLRMRGLPRSRMLAIEFCDTAGEDGFYRKYSIFRIGDAYVPRYVHVGSHWMTKEYSRTPEEKFLREEMEFLGSNPHGDWAREVFEAAKIDYGRLDYGICEGRPQAWEINFTPVLSGNPDRGEESEEKRRIRRLTLPAKKIAHGALQEAFLKLDPAPLEGEAVRVEFPDGLEAQAARERMALNSVERGRARIARIAAAPGLRRIGPLLRRMLVGVRG